MNAFAMLHKQIPDIIEAHSKAKTEEEKVTIINSISELHNDVRQKSKPCGFLLQYGGTDAGLQKNLGFSKEDAIQIYNGYCKLYAKTIEWTNARIDQAKIDGYVTTGFGLRVRTPLLKGAIGDLSGIQAAESRTAGNALGQGWGVLNDRAMNEVLEEVDRLGLTEDILPAGKVH